MDKLLKESNCISVYFHRLQESFFLQESVSTRKRIEKAIPFQLIKICYFMELPQNVLPESLEEVMKKIEEQLIEEFVVFEDEEKELACIVGYDDKKEELPDYFFIWSLFQYIYSNTKAGSKERQRFLWVTILLPYIYRCGQYGQVDEGVIRQLLEKYPLEEKALNLFLRMSYPGDKKAFEQYYKGMVLNSEMYAVPVCSFEAWEKGMGDFFGGVAVMNRLLKGGVKNG